jgi:hypothetical protein
MWLYVMAALFMLVVAVAAATNLQIQDTIFLRECGLC